MHSSDHTLDSFDRIRDLERDELEELLLDPDPRLRVWASWALGLRLDSAIVPILRERVDDEGHPGVRRHFVRILAGFGDLSTLRRLEHGDPDPLVRREARTFRRRCRSDRDPSTDSES